MPYIIKTHGFIASQTDRGYILKAKRFGVLNHSVNDGFYVVERARATRFRSLVNAKEFMRKVHLNGKIIKVKES